MTSADLIALVKKHPIAFACGLVVVLAGVWLYFDSGSIEAAQAAFNQKDQESRKIAANARATHGLAEQTEEMQAGMKQMEARVLRVADLANNLQVFYRLEAETGVKLVDARQNPLVKPKAGAPKTIYVAVPFTVMIQGNYAQVWSFLRRLETLPQFVRGNKLTLTKVESPGPGVAPDAMTANFTLEMLGTP